jgi:SAM-dependent methyltransferase
MALTSTTDFRAVYHVPGVYEQVLVPHYFDGAEDTELIARFMREHYGQPRNNQCLNVMELGCGTGRVTQMLAPYAGELHGVDSGAPMIAAFRERFPHASAECRDTREAVEAMHAEGRAGTFDVVGAFWSLSYPVLDLFEEMTADGIQPKADAARALVQAQELVRRILGLVAPRGHLMILFFDSETPEQRLVTRLWERIAPFPGNGRGYAREIVVDVLADAERRGEGRLLHLRRGGLAVAANVQAARQWFEVVHLKSFPALINDLEVRTEIDTFIAKHELPSGEVLIPSGVHVIDFWKVGRPAHLPNGRSHGQ